MDRGVLRASIRGGLVAGFIVIYLSMVGMVERFDNRDLISEVLSLGRVAMLLPLFIGGLVVTRPKIERGERRAMAPKDAALAGALTGAVGGLFTALWLAVISGFGQETVRSIFVRVSPDMLDVVRFGTSLGGAAVIVVVLGAALGAAGATARLIPTDVLRPTMTAVWVVTFAALLQRVIPPAMRNLGLDSSWLYSRITGGLTIFGVVALAVVAAGVAALVRWRGQGVRDLYDGLQGGPRYASRIGLTIGLAVLVVAMPHILGSALSENLGTVGVFLLMGLGLNIVVGYAGLLDLGYVAFFAVGAYSTAILTGANLVGSLGETTSPAFSLNLNFYVAIPLVVILAAFVGILIGAPVLRLRGDYLAIVTLGFGEIARVLVTSDALRDLLGGAQGLRDVTDAQLLGISFRDPVTFFYLVSAFCALAVYITWRLSDSRVGRAWSAMREDEQVASAMGISTTKYKLLAFAMGGAIGSFSGALFAVKIGSLTPRSFEVLVSIIVLAIVILGGLGSIKGVIAGTFVLIGLPLVLTEFEEFRLLVYGALLVAIMVLKPEGLFPNVRRSRELRDEDRAQDQWFKKAGTAVEGEA